ARSPPATSALADLIRQPFVPCQNPTSQSSGDESDQEQQQQQHIIELYESCPEDCSLRDRVATLLLGGGGGGFATALQSALKRQYRGAQLLSERIKAKDRAGLQSGGRQVGRRCGIAAASQQEGQTVVKEALRGHLNLFNACTGFIANFLNLIRFYNKPRLFILD
uniref:PNPLA domain-containing protein n=1 Tax=Macrostomum lignano TaxID=282301 RepID=A0A1I8FPJ6_9PLAT